MEPVGDPTGSGEAQTSASRTYPLSFSIFALARAHRALAAMLLADLGLYPGQELILMSLWEHDAQSQKSLTETLRLDHSTIAKSVRRLETAGLVTRRRSDVDGRVNVVSLTEAGRGLEPHVRAAWSDLERATARGLSPSDQSRFVALAHKIAPNLE